MANGNKNSNNGEGKAETKIIGTSDPDLRTTTKAATGFVVIGCKLPNGIIMQLSQFSREAEPVMGGGHREVKMARKVGDKYVIKGPAVPVGTIPRFLIAGGYALTSGIPADFAEEWFEQNKDSDIVKNELVIMHKSVEDVENHALQNENVRSGLEPLDPSRLPRGIETAEEMGKRVGR